MRGIHWFRNDLRLQDNLALGALAGRVDEWLPVFVLDPKLLERNAQASARLRFLVDCLERLGADLASRGVPLQILEGEAETQIPELMRETRAEILSWNASATPLGQRRDARVRAEVEKLGGASLEMVDHVVFGPREILTGSGTVYSVYTPYRKTWWAQWNRAPRPPAARSKLPKAPIPGYENRNAPRKRALGKSISAGSHERRLPTGGEEAARRRLRDFLAGPARDYHEDRDRPAVDGTSRLSPYLRFGAISIRKCVADGLRAGTEDRGCRAGVGKWLDELIWRDFYNAVLENSPHVLTGNFRSEYDGLEWSSNDEHFAAWCEGRTGYPFVDAGMRQLRETAWMHNRVRMVVASFLTKDLLIDWRAGERFFAESLVDGDPASNNGGWQWAASTGTDAQPYFRIFNPVTQGEKWDPSGDYVRRWVPELRNIEDRFIHSPWLSAHPSADYPPPIVDHAAARLRTLAEFKRVRAANREQ